MKNLRTAVLCACIALCSKGSFGQSQPIPINEPDYNKPKLFTGLPEKISVSADDLNSLFNTPVGQAASLRSNEVNGVSQVQFDGELISSVSKDQGAVQTIIVRSTNYAGARMTLSRITDAAGVVSYIGRIMSLRHGDLYELQKLEGQLVLVKKNFYDLVNE